MDRSGSVDFNWLPQCESGRLGPPHAIDRSGSVDYIAYHSMRLDDHAIDSSVSTD